MTPEAKAKVMFGMLGLICGGLIAMIIGFSWGGWITSSASKTMTEEAVLASKATICVAQFIKNPNYKENLKEFEKRDSYGMKNTSDYVQNLAGIKCPGKKKLTLM